MASRCERRSAPPVPPRRTDRRRSALGHAFDEARFGAARTLNLRDGLPSAADATERAERWLRGRQAEAAADEVLIITGRGNQSVDGVGVIRAAVARLFPLLRRRGVIREAREHSPGSFVVQLAPLRALVEAPRRSRRDATPPLPRDPAALAGLEPTTRAALRRLAAASLAALGIQAPTDDFVADEMVRQFTTLAATVPDGPDREARLARVVMRALSEYEA